MSRRLLTCLLLVLVLAGSHATAQERILSYDSDIVLNADGSLDVSEHIRVRAEGHQIRRGLTRDFPTRYKDRHGNRIRVGFEMLGVERDGKPEPWFTEALGNGVRINTGNDDFLPVPAEYTFTLRYRTTRQLGFFDDHDELYWNAIGTGSIFPIEGGTVTARLPQPVPIADMSAEGYTGRQGVKGQAYAAELVAPGEAHWQLTAPLVQGEGFSIVLMFPKGVVAAPTRTQRAWWLLRDNGGGLIALAGLALTLLVGVMRWRAVGRDPDSGPIVVEYDPPDGLSPAVLRGIRQSLGNDTRGFSADLLAMAVGRQLTILRDKKLLSDHWRLERNGSNDAATSPEQARLLEKLFAGGDTLVFEQKNASRIQGIMQAHHSMVRQRIKSLFPNGVIDYNAGSIMLVLAVVAVSTVAALMYSTITGTGVGIVVPIVVAMVIAWLVLMFLLPKVTREGLAMRDRIEGFRRYLSVADRDDLKRLEAPGDGEPTLDAARFESLLPYAVALDVEDAWTRKFTTSVGAAAAQQAAATMHWYHPVGHAGDIGDLGNFTKSIGKSLVSQISSSSSPPGSASGGGGGGFSGGGGGGGGVGGR